MIKAGFTYQPDDAKQTSHSLRASIPLKVTKLTGNGMNEIEGRLEAIAEGKAQICLDQPLEEGTKLELLVEVRDRRNRQICFRYEGNIASAVTRRWYEMEVHFEQGVGISGKDARQILADLFPEDG